MSNKKNENKGQTYTTGKVTLLFPHFNKPYAFNDNDTPKYQVQILFSKDSPEVNNFKNLIAKEWKLNNLQKTDHNPLRDGDEKAKSLENEGKNGDIYKGMYFIKAASQFPIKVYTKRKGELWIGDDNDINGWYGRVMLTLKAYTNGFNKGVTAYLKATQVLEKGEIEFFDASSNFDFDENENNNFDLGDDDELPF